MFFPHCWHASALTASTHRAEHQMSYKQLFNVALWSWLGGSLSSSPQTDRSHAFPSGQWRHQVLLAQELQGEVNQQPSDGFQLLRCLLWVCVTEALLCGVLLQLTQVVDSVIGQAFEDLREDPRHRQSENKVKNLARTITGKTSSVWFILCHIWWHSV